MTQFILGLAFYIFLILPPVANLVESIMVTHMHMQMPALVIAGFLMGHFFEMRFPNFFQKWNHNGIPGILLFIIIVVYWTIPRSMDETLTMWSMELFKFISLPFLAGIPLRNSWMKLTPRVKNWVISGFTVKFLGMGLLYIYTPDQLCNNYLKIDQLTLGWSFLTTGIAMVGYLLYIVMIDPSKYEAP